MKSRKRVNSTHILSIFAFSLVIAVGFTAFRLSSPAPQPVTVAEVTAGGTVSLEASPPPNHLVLGREYTFNINAHSGSSHVTAVQLELIYDPAKLQITHVTKTGYLPVYLASPVIAGGMVKTTVGAEPDSGGKADWGTVVSFTVKAIALGSSSLEFGSGSLASTLETNGNSLGSIRNELITAYNVGDIDFSKTIDLFDYNLFIKDYGKTGYSPANLDGLDGVNLFDFNLFVANYGKTSP